MGRRTSAGRSIPGNALGGVLRATQRQARAATRRVASALPEAEDVAPAATQPRPMAGVPRTGPDGVAIWIFPETLAAPPVVTATVAARYCATASVRWVTNAAAALHVWDQYGDPVEAGVEVHVVVFPR